MELRVFGLVRSVFRTFSVLTAMIYLGVTDTEKLGNEVDKAFRGLAGKTAKVVLRRTNL